MKILLCFLGLFLPATVVLADGSPTYRVRFTVELISGKVQKGYAIAHDFQTQPDSLISIRYLKEALTEDYRVDEADVLDTLIFYSDMLEYRYVWPGADTATTFQLVNEMKIPYAAIKNIRVDTFVLSGWGDIVNELELSDAKWLNTPPVKHINLNGYLCGFLVIVHKSDKEVEAVLKELEALEKKYLADMDPEKEGNEEENRTFPEYDIDHEFFELFYKLKGHKVVIIESCTC